MAKSQSTAGREGTQLLAILDGRSCPSCEDGELKRGVYKDKRAVICDSCETPQAQVWTTSQSSS